MDFSSSKVRDRDFEPSREDKLFCVFSYESKLKQSRGDPSIFGTTFERARE